MTEIAETPMSMNNFDLLANDNVSKDRKEREDSWKCCLPVYDEERNVVDLQAICKISHSGTTLISMSDDYNFVAAID